MAGGGRAGLASEEAAKRVPFHLPYGEIGEYLLFFPIAYTKYCNS